MRVFWSDAFGLAPGREMETVRGEVETIFGAAGVGVEWADAPFAAAGASPRDVTVVLTPSLPGGEGLPIERGAMGVYLRSASAPESSVVFVFYERVVEVLGGHRRSRNTGLMDATERRRIARALARVAVHEIVHRMRPGLPHSESGLMQSRLDRSILTRHRLLLDERSSDALALALSESPEKGRGPLARGR